MSITEGAINAEYASMCVKDTLGCRRKSINKCIFAHGHVETLVHLPSPTKLDPLTLALQFFSHIVHRHIQSDFGSAVARIATGVCSERTQRRRHVENHRMFRASVIIIVIIAIIVIVGVGFTVEHQRVESLCHQYRPHCVGLKQLHHVCLRDRQDRIVGVVLSANTSIVNEQVEFGVAVILELGSRFLDALFIRHVQLHDGEALARARLLQRLQGSGLGRRSTSGDYVGILIALEKMFDLIQQSKGGRGDWTSVRRKRRYLCYVNVQGGG